MISGELLSDEGDINLNPGKETTSVAVANTGDRPVQVGSHVHFFEVNRALRFDRERAYGRPLSIAAGTSVRFEPGDERTVELTPFGGRRVVREMNGLVEGALDDPEVREAALRRARERGFVEDS